MDLESIMTNEISQTEKDRCCHLCGILKMKQSNLYSETDSDIENKLVVTSGG